MHSLTLLFEIMYLQCMISMISQPTDQSDNYNVTNLQVVLISRINLMLLYANEKIVGTVYNNNIDNNNIIFIAYFLVGLLVWCVSTVLCLTLLQC